MIVISGVSLFLIIVAIGAAIDSAESKNGSTAESPPQDEDY